MLIQKQEKGCPMGTGQRRPSRSPRSQRSRSADVDCLKKYTERRVEERRYTEIPDTSKLDPSRWIPLPKTIAAKKSPQSKEEEKRCSITESEEIDGSKTSLGTPKKLSPTKEEEPKDSKDRGLAATHKSSTGRSQSTDVGNVKHDKLVEERRHTECSDSRMVATRWLPQITTSRFCYDASPFTRITNCEITKNAAARWMTFVKNPSTSTITRVTPERKPSATETSTAIDDSPSKSVRNQSPKWEPMRKFSSAAAKDIGSTGQKLGDPGCNRDSPSKKLSPDSNEQSQRLNQRMRDLYDFKTENEWPKRAINARRQNAWISKSSSEEDRGSQPIRRNSQDLEFNDRLNVIKLKDTKVQSNHQEPKPPPRRDPKIGEIFNSEYEERLRKFNERLRFSEDLGLSRPKIKERRTYSDDYDEKNRRGSTKSTNSESATRVQSEKKRPSDASNKSRGSYAEVSPAKRDSRTSDASYASIGSHPVKVVNHPAKRASVDCKSSRQMVELPPRRAFSQTDDKPGSPGSSVEGNDRQARLKLISERQKRDSTRYKVYLT